MGCLGPKPRAREVYLDLIEAIYREIETLSLPVYLMADLVNKIHMSSSRVD